MEIKDSKFKPTAKGNPMWMITAKVVGGPHNNRQVWDNIVLTPDSPGALGYFFAKMKAVGLPQEYFKQHPTNEQIAEAMKGRRFRAQVGFRTYQGEKKNEIQKYFPAQDGATPAAPGGAPAAPAAPPVAAAPPMPAAAPPPAPAAPPAPPQAAPPAPPAPPAPAPQPQAAPPAPPAQDPWAAQPAAPAAPAPAAPQQYEQPADGGIPAPPPPPSAPF
jgi:hypothetical protein